MSVLCTKSLLPKMSRSRTEMHLATFLWLQRKHVRASDPAIRRISRWRARVRRERRQPLYELSSVNADPGVVRV
ncbi:hypothetical protein BIW11_14375 [Tropilaelaps mercedesae]|uniref:Uncharacterized protein n=1 Tax=Tropilaelaps mercedesae TaxID=418985 RepID=A0A1V9WXY0_9ACAR|nr:hypothetical protein BIW11_14375 [Tropilaelaps mercedesae]